MMNFTLDGRLSVAAKFARQGARFADVGTDHAYLPIFLLKTGRVDFAVCSDINAGPLENARENAIEAGVFDKIAFTLADGAAALEKFSPTDVAICGMGGELIAGIIEKAPFLKKCGMRLILQPMTRPAPLRKKLAALGFLISAEEYSTAAGKHYVTICADFCDTPHTLSKTEAEFGREEFIICGGEHARAYLEKKKNALSRAALGKTLGAADSSDEAELLSYIESVIPRIK
ncbi:MAG: SAM-dependent methyltransferase [Clostridia bacterium]|nr:SAM-dependent methyltransferase [Clostridia bacterium]